MTPEQQRIAIAEACGWTKLKQHPEISFLIYGQVPKIEGQAWSSSHFPIPDYLNDLNAMHEAELVFIGEDKSPNYFDYRQQLYRVCCLSSELAVRATAAQRAEAFLRTLNLWTL